jgi:hypothetical protein
LDEDIVFDLFYRFLRTGRFVVFFLLVAALALAGAFFFFSVVAFLAVFLVVFLAVFLSAGVLVAFWADDFSGFFSGSADFLSFLVIGSEAREEPASTHARSTA